MACGLLPVSVVIDYYYCDSKTLIQAGEEHIAENEAQLNELLEEEAENFLDADTFENKILTASISDLAERYGQTLPGIDKEITGLENKVKQHLAAMGLHFNKASFWQCKFRI